MRKTLRLIKGIILAPFRFIAWIVRWLFRSISSTYHSITNLFTDEPQDTPLPDAFAKVAQDPRQVLPHLDELRKHLLRAVLVLGLTTTISFTFAQSILEFLTRPLTGGLKALVAIEITEPISTLMRVSLLSGFALALPYITLEIWLYIAPGLKRRSRRISFLAIPMVFIFFLAGMSFAYYIILPTAVPFLLNILGIPTQVRPSSYITFVTGLLFWVGVAFEFPLVIYFLASVGVIKAKALTQQWRLAVVLIAILSAIITPTIDPVNMFIVMSPLILLYFLSIGVAHLAQRGDSKE